MPHRTTFKGPPAAFADGSAVTLAGTGENPSWASPGGLRTGPLHAGGRTRQAGERAGAGAGGGGRAGGRAPPVRGD
jgi:hypothetical protein